MSAAAFKNSVWILLAAGLLTAGCGGDVKRASLYLRQGANLPCLGVRRIKATVFKDEESGKSAEVFGKYYHVDGNCNLPVGLLLEISGLPYTEEMSIQVEGFDSSKGRRMCLGIMEQVTRQRVQSGDLGELALEREAVYENGEPKYPTGTLVIPPLPGLDTIENIESLTFILNPYNPEPYKINGSFLTDPSVPLNDTTLILSNVLPTAPTGNILFVTAYYKNISVGKWENTSAFAVNEGDVFVDVPMSMEQ